LERPETQIVISNSKEQDSKMILIKLNNILKGSFLFE
jgi:hypothetical protein